MSWELITIGEHCTVTSSKRFHLSERCKDGIPFYCSKEIIQKVNGQEVTDCDYISEEVYEQVKKQFGVPETGDLLITTRGTYGIPYIYSKTDRFYFADGNLTWLKEFDKYLLPQYLYFWVLSYEGQKKIDAIAKGTAQKAVPIASIKSISLRLPCIRIQQKIVDILSAYDEFIENNRRQIKLLEEAAQRLYKEWFVDLRFPGWETTEIVDGVPVRWKKVPVGDTIEYEIGGGWGNEEADEYFDAPAYIIRGTDLYGINHGDYSNLPFRYHKQGNLNARKLQDRDIIFEVSGGSKTEGVAKTLLLRNQFLKQMDYPVMCASFCKLVRTKKQYSAQYMFDTFQYMRRAGITQEYDKKSASSIVNYRWKDFLSQQMVLIPESEVLEKYAFASKSVYDLIIKKSIAIEKAKQARDRLLPKLMSGKLEV